MTEDSNANEDASFARLKAAMDAKRKSIIEAQNPAPEEPIGDSAEVSPPSDLGGSA